MFKGDLERQDILLWRIIWKRKVSLNTHKKSADPCNRDWKFTGTCHLLLSQKYFNFFFFWNFVQLCLIFIPICKKVYIMEDKVYHTWV